MAFFMVTSLSDGRLCVYQPGTRTPGPAINYYANQKSRVRFYPSGRPQEISRDRGSVHALPSGDHPKVPSLHRQTAVKKRRNRKTSRHASMNTRDSGFSSLSVCKNPVSFVIIITSTGYDLSVMVGGITFWQYLANTMKTEHKLRFFCLTPSRRGTGAGKIRFYGEIVPETTIFNEGCRKGIQNLPVHNHL